MLVTRWEFKAESFDRENIFDLYPEIPFVGDYKSAQQEAQKRIARWEDGTDDTICHVELRPVIPEDGRLRGVH